jgi:hypothetical protein
LKRSKKRPSLGRSRPNMGDFLEGEAVRLARV